MEDLITRTGGESETRAGKLIPSFVIDTAGAPASAPAPGEKVAAAPEWIELLPAGVFYGRDGRGPFRLDDPTTVIESTIALQMNAALQGFPRAWRWKHGNVRDRFQMIGNAVPPPLFSAAASGLSRLFGIS